MIPKIIHYCWLSDEPIPDSIQYYINSWKKHLSDYEFILWNFKVFDKKSSKWVSQAFDNKKYAFAADYIRLYALYNYGGIYLDTDVEVLQSFNPFLKEKEFLSRETTGGPEVAVLGVEKGSKWIKICLDRYKDRPFIKEDGSFDMIPLPQIVEETLHNNGYAFKDIQSFEEKSKLSINEIPILPSEYFSPKSYDTGKIYKTNKTVAIHHFNGSWLPWYVLLEKNICSFLSIKFKNYIGRIISKIRCN